MLEHQDLHRAGEVMRGLLEAMREDLWQISATSIDSWGRGLTPALNALYLAALGPSLRPSDQLRFRTATPVPSRPALTDTEVLQRARKVPSMFWPAWALRLSLSNEVYPRVLTPALACALLVVGSRTSLDGASQHLGGAIDGITVSRTLQMLNGQPFWPDMTTALARLADHLDSNSVPIDYQRRRNLDYRDLLPHELWVDICRRTGTPPSQGRREQIFRCRLFQRISGLPAEAAPGYRQEDEAPFRAETARAAIHQTPELAAELDRAAREFLTAGGIEAEPVTWQPPTTLLDGLDLPGLDPAPIDLPHLHDLIRRQKKSVQHAAAVFGTSIETIRYVLNEHPAPALPQDQATARATGATRRRARRELTREDFARLYSDEHQSLNQISAATGFSRKVLTALAHDYGIPLRDGPQDYQPRGTVDRDWLIEQYVHCHRTLPDLAREKGMSTSNMARWAKTHSIPLRPRGSASHNQALRAADEAGRAPRILRPALTGRGASERLSRFAAASAHPSLSASAAALGLNTFTLVAQINRIERELSGPLLVRAERGRPMTLTPLGKKVLKAIRKMQDNTMP
ncbi:helix-turn-helix domain-containing protein [Streptomyces acidicola]|uniref:helix-turn-helix domain-containing protein n=1 Tax=Streptomyces acidicola TaxID=2596892 RepID=UPI00342AC8D3